LHYYINLTLTMSRFTVWSHPFRFSD